MGQPRARKPGVVVISSDEDDSDGAEDILTDEEKAEEEIETARSTRSTTKKSDQQKVAKNIKHEPTPPPTELSQQCQTSKRATKPAPTKAKGTIYSFFNAATQKQKEAAQRPVSPRRSPAPRDTDDIDDTIDENDAAVPFAKGSQIALAQRKRKAKDLDHFTVAQAPLSSSAPQKFRKISDGTKANARPQTEDKRPWTDQYGPVDLSELAVHKKKVTDVRKLLEEALSPRARPRLIVLKGAAGTGKTATIQLLAKDLGVEVKEWRNPVGADVGSDSYTSASAQFEDFILRSGKFSGLSLVSDSFTTNQPNPKTVQPERTTSDGRRHIMLVEEFPNTFTKSSNVLSSFRSTIQQYLSLPRSATQSMAPVILIISEALLSVNTAVADSFTAHRVLGPNILTHPLTAELEFNAIAPTILTKALDLIVIKEARKSGRRKTPGPSVLTHLAESGDIRSAISSLEFLCLRGDSDPASWSAKVAFTKPKSRTTASTPLTKQEQESLALISNRETTFGLFHSVGKVVYNKRLPAPNIPQPPTHLTHYRRDKIPETDPDILLASLGTDSSTFVAALHENYPLSCATSSSETTLDSLNGCLDALSDADILSPDRFSTGRNYVGAALDGIRADDMAFTVAVRGVLFSLPYPVHRDDGRGQGAFKMLYPSSLRVWKQREEIEGLIESVDQNTAASTATAKEGVESWRRNRAETSTEDKEEVFLDRSSREEVVLYRLPFLARILKDRDVMKERVKKITSFTGFMNSNHEEHEEEGDGQEGRRKGRKTETEGGGLRIPVEHAVERLVLSDDDIED